MAISTILIFLIVLGIIVFVHELGHFATAKFFGVKVEEFGLGFPPKIIGRKKGETEYTLNWIPLGGFCKIVGEDGENRVDPRSFGAKPIWQRMIILAAGVAMNFLLAIVLFSVVFMSGFPTDVSGVPTEEIPSDAKISIQLSEVAPGGAAEEAGLTLMDEILKINGIAVSETSDIQGYVRANPDQTATFTIKRQDETLQKEIQIRKNETTGEGVIGVSLAKTAMIHYSFFESIRGGFTYTAEMTKYIFEYLFTTIKQLFTTGGTSAQISGPVGMVTMTEQASQMGLMVLLNFIALISVNLAIVNILPLPALDGGRILFLLVEKIKGSPVSHEFEAKVHNAGFTLLMLLMVIITLQDIARLGIWSKLMLLF